MSGNKLPLRMDFVCSNCGKIVNRLVSQVENKDLVFCDPYCKGMYAQKKQLDRVKCKKSYFQEDIKDVEIKRIMNFVIKKYRAKYRYTQAFYDAELEQECLIAIWKHNATANDGLGNKQGFYRVVFRNAIKDFLKKFVHLKLEVGGEEAESFMKNKEQSTYNDTGYADVVKQLKEFSKNSDIWGVFYDYYLTEKTMDEVAKERGVSRKFVKNRLKIIEDAITA